MNRFEVLGGRAPTAEEVAAIAAALAVVFGSEPDRPEPRPWRWSGRTWARPHGDWIRRVP